jgi:hypothetical protein
MIKKYVTAKESNSCMSKLILSYSKFKATGTAQSKATDDGCLNNVDWGSKINTIGTTTLQPHLSYCLDS